MIARGDCPVQYMREIRSLASHDQGHSEADCGGCAAIIGPANPWGAAMSDQSNVKARHAAVANALANQRLEGLEPDSKVVLDLQRFARGECEIETVLKNFQARIASGEVFR
jgi:xanthine dehydrogenase iron-sulfur cluster and FAD-binding subunit A